MRLFIAEKPSLGRAIAEALPKPLKKGEGFVTAANGDTVSWCIGHLLELQEPEAYNPAFKKWSHEHLPIIPLKWLLTPKRNTSKQLAVLRSLVKQASSLVHAGDPDREGQLLVDELINYLGVKGDKKATVQRCLINDLNPAAVSQAVTNLRRNQDFIPLSTSALARSRADWLYGINLTRAYTLQGQQAGYKGVLSVGRVQTPVLGLVVRRDLAIAAFVSHPFYEVWAQLETAAGERFKAKWHPSAACQPYLDEQGRNLSQPLAANVARRISGQPGTVSRLQRDHKKQAAALPYSLSTLQIDASKAFGLSAQQTLDICQELYEKYQLITYPRSDCRYLPTEHLSQAAAVVAAIDHNLGQLNSQAIATLPLNFQQKSRAWNDAKVSAHHAIIPTLKRHSGLSKAQSQIYGLVSRNYLIQFMAPYEFASTEVEVLIAAGTFIAKAIEPKVDGWKQLFPKRSSKSGGAQGERNEEVEQLLPTLSKGQILASLEAELLTKATSAPKPYSDATLLAAMTGIGAHVSDPAVRKILKDTDGLGTEATRAGIIELLFKRGFLLRQGKSIVASDTGRIFITALPEVATTPDMTARWEAQLTAIAEGRGQYQALMEPLTAQLQDMTVASRSVIPNQLKGLGTAKVFGKKKRARKKTSG